MTDSERRTAAARFAADWKGRGDEKQFRLSSTKAATQRSADTPTLFQEIRHPDSEYIIVPRHSSEARRYIPFGFVAPEIIVNDAVQIIPNAGIYHYDYPFSSACPR